MTTMLQETRPLPAPAPAPAAPYAPHAVPGAADARRGELAAFLRSRRERVTPEQAGLPRGPRRRTPGLRREEVAHLAAVGVTWYTWLEQARDIKVSAQVLDSIARALMLDRVERSHLFALAETADPMPDTTCLGVSEQLRMMLERLEPFPACVQNARYDIRAYNRAYGRLMGGLDSLPVEEHNCLWLAFTHPRIGDTFVDRPEVIQSMAAKFRASMAEHIADPAWNCLLKRLLDASPEFRALWARHEVAPPTARTARVFQHPEAGLLRLNLTSLWVGPQSGARLVTFVPADETTRERLELLR